MSDCDKTNEPVDSENRLRLANIAEQVANIEGLTITIGVSRVSASLVEGSVVKRYEGADHIATLLDSRLEDRQF